MIEPIDFVFCPLVHCPLVYKFCFSVRNYQLVTEKLPVCYRETRGGFGVQRKPILTFQIKSG